jgi:hypothetical protein
MNYHSPWPAVLEGLAGFFIALLIIVIPLLILL